MGVDEHKARKAIIATNNGTYDEVFQYIEQHNDDPEFNQVVTIHKKKKKPRYIPLELQNLFTQLFSINKYSVSTQGDEYS